MEREAYKIEAQVVEDHWWFRGRRKLFSKEISDAGIKNTARVLDVGTSTGTNLIMLKENGFDWTVGLDLSPDALLSYKNRELGPVMGGVAERLPFAENCFDLVLATDILEHLDDDSVGLKEIARVLKPGGTALFTVPAFQCLWGLQDEVSEHRRRYRLKQLRNVIQSENFSINKAYYFNFFLFIPILCARKIITLFNIQVSSENSINDPWVNKLLYMTFILDVKLAPLIRPWFGISACVVATKGPTQQKPISIN